MKLYKELSNVRDGEPQNKTLGRNLFLKCVTCFGFHLFSSDVNCNIFQSRMKTLLVASLALCILPAAFAGDFKEMFAEFEKLKHKVPAASERNFDIGTHRFRNWEDKQEVSMYSVESSKLFVFYYLFI